MKSTKKINRLIGGVIIGLILFFGIPHVQGGEIKFLKIKFMHAQEQMGSAIIESGQLRWRYGQVQERLGQIIREAGLISKIDQTLLGQEIAKAAHLKWEVGRAEEELGSAIVTTAMVVSKEAAINGEGAIQERLGAMIQAKAKQEWADAQEAKQFAQVQAGEIQEKRGREIQKSAQLRWAEGVLTRTVQDALRSSPARTAPAHIPSDALSVIRTEIGFEPEERLRLAMTLSEGEKGTRLTAILPAAVAVTPTGVPKHTEVGWRGWGALAALLGFAWAMAMLSWTLTDLDRVPIKETEEKKEEKPAALRKAA